ncbi:MAG: 16S rRNA (guanine(966)-N(2))-methyltransferase RsmD [Gemmatimonadota bacterium]|nr:MAG: 16S rRNA (guanine(966)-N(2))-methyltransferase RsmD [Gemmatimonadota bacterium]
MRVITGKAKGLRLKTLKGSNKRPTTDRVKESIFSVIGEKVYEADVLDLFAGTGNLGIEALSRGARTALFIDNDHRATRIIEENLELTRFRSKSEIWTSDVFTALLRLRTVSRAFDVIFADPPYEKGFGTKTLVLLEENGLLNTGGICILEHPIREEIRIASNRMKLMTHKLYGQTAVHFFQDIDTEE